MFLRQISDPHLAQYAYLIGCQRTGEAIVIDPQRDVERYRQIAAENELRLTAVAETHIHADFVSGARALVETHDARGYLSTEGGPDWQSEWARGLANITLLHDGDNFRIGNIRFDVLHTPGHTPEHICFLVTDEGGGANEPMALLSGDFLFVGDAGRPDLLETAAGVIGTRDEGAHQLHTSLQRLAKLPEHLQVLPAHGAGSACGKALGSVPMSTVGYERRFNPTLRLALNGSVAEFTNSILAGQPEPPLYFAEMKRLNRAGPALIAGPTRPRVWTVEEAVASTSRVDVTIVDTRSREDFMRGHLGGSLFAPAAGNFSDFAGSYLLPADEIVLVVEHERQVGPLTTQLFRIGFDQVAGWILGSNLIPTVVGVAEIRPRKFAELESLLASEPRAAIIDVRRATEFATGHLRGAINIAHTRLRSRIKEVLTAPFLIVHCQAGNRAAAAAAFLRRADRDVVLLDDSFANVPLSLLERI
jgi:hydroxyacylglutathione hydrolase